MNIFKRIIGFLVLGFSVTAAAQELAPDQLVQKVTEEVLASIKSDKQLAAGDKQKALKLAEEKVLPYIDFEESTRLAVGRAWSQATPEQRKKLVNEFRNMLVRTYSNAIESYQGQTMKVMPSRGGKGDAKRRGDGARAVRPRRRQAAADRVPDAQRWQELEGLRHRRSRASAWCSPTAASSTPW